tara:strand:- start:973 stop:1104 length:132 start_codon:yes stop_codon:yes gene_type:complete
MEEIYEMVFYNLGFGVSINESLKLINRIDLESYFVAEQSNQEV